MILKPGLITLAFVLLGRDGVRRYEIYLHTLLEKSNDKKIAKY
jgi:hypothetical protein